MPRRLRHLLVTAAPALALAVVATAARAGDVSLDDVAVKSSDAKRTIVIKHIDVKGSSLSPDDVRKLMSGELAPADEKALAAKFSADSLSAPQIDVKSVASTFTVHNFRATGIAAGRIARADFDGADIAGAKPGQSGHVGAAHGEGLRFQDVGMAAGQGAGDGGGGVTQMTLAGADLQTPENGSDNLVHVVVGPVDFTASYGGDFLSKVEFTLKGITVSFAPNSNAGASLKAFGYDKVELSAQSAVTCDKNAKTCGGGFTLTSPNAAALTVKGDFGNVATNPGGADPAALMAQTVSSLEISLVNSGLVDKIIETVARQQHSNAAALKAKISAMTAMAPLMIGDADAGKKIGDAVGAFIADPKTLTLSVKAKGAPVAISELATIRKPADALAKFSLDAKANQ